MAQPLDPTTIGRSKKERLLRQFSEDDFRDRVVRPLLLRRGLQDGRDLCGPTEHGKDAIFLAPSAIGPHDVYALQTKVGNINLGSKVTDNLMAALTQLRTALATPYHFIHERRSVRPSKVILAASGKINEAARAHIVNEVNDSQIVFMDVNDLIPSIDADFPELWFEIETSTAAYLRNLISVLRGDEGTRSLALQKVQDPFFCPATQGDWVTIRVNKVSMLARRQGRRTIPVPKFDEIPFTSLHKGREPRVLVLGDAGSGKSSALRRLAAIAAADFLEGSPAGRIPLIARAGDVLHLDLQALLSHIASETASISGTGSPGFTAEDLLQGKTVLCVDALDEVPEPDARKSVVRVLLEFSRDYPRTKIILTCRDYTWVSDIPGVETFTRYRISPIEWKQAIQIIQRFQSGKALPEPRAMELVRRIQQIHGMALNPLLVTVFASTSDFNRSAIPANITELFKKFTEVMLGRWDADKGMTQQYHAPLKDFLLQRVATTMHRAKITSISVDEFDRILAGELSKRGKASDVKTLREEIVRRSGLFRVLGTNIEFSHLLLQEFFAGRGLDTTEAVELIADPWWQRAIVFHFGENPSRIEALEWALPRLRDSNGRSRAQCAVTLGLSAQACYLGTLESQVQIAGHIITALSKAMSEMFGKDAPESRRPLIEFIAAYIEFRDAAAMDCLRTAEADVRSRIGHDEPALAELHEFWQIAGLMEVGATSSALTRVKSYSPDDLKTLMCIHLGAYVSAKLRVGSSDDKRLATEICSRLEPMIRDLRISVVQELKSELLEWRQGRVEALPDPRDES